MESAEYDRLVSVANVARQHGITPSAVSRWIVHGIKLRDGSRLKLRAVRLPGGFRSTERWLGEFVAALTADRCGPESAAELVEDRARRAESVLAASGW